MFFPSDAWIPLYNDVNQYIQVDLSEETPVYGIEMAGSVDLDSYITTFNVLYGDDGNVFSFIEDNGQPKVNTLIFLIN